MVFDAEDIIFKLEKLYPGIELEIEETENAYIMPTICHNETHEEAKKKLYLYKNSGLFHCYTECGCTFNIWQLIKKRSILEGRDIKLDEQPKAKKQDYSVLTDTLRKLQEFKSPLEFKMEEYDDRVLEVFPKANSLHPWALEGIDVSALDKFNIRYSKSYNWVVIPQYDWRGRLIGIRRRTYNPNELVSMKYGPLFMNEKYYTHKLSFNLYGLNLNLLNIQKYRTVVIAESEKSVLQSETMFKDNLTVAICGSQIHQPQIDLLVKLTGAKVAIVALDKEYKNTEEMSKYFLALEKRFRIMAQYMDVYILIDEKNIFNYKESPFDRTINDFNKLNKWKVSA